MSSLRATFTRSSRFNGLKLGSLRRLYGSPSGDAPYGAKQKSLKLLLVDPEVFPLVATIGTVVLVAGGFSLYKLKYAADLSPPKTLSPSEDSLSAVTK